MTAFLSHVTVCLRSFRQRRGERGHVHPGQPSERGHPAQLHQHLQRRRLRLRRPGRFRSVQWSHHIKPEHRGEPAEEGHGPGTAARQLMVLQLMVLQQGGVRYTSCAPSRPQREGIGSRFSLDHLFIYFWWVSCFLKMSSLINEDKRTGTLGVSCKNPCFCIMWLIYCSSVGF